MKGGEGKVQEKALQEGGGMGIIYTLSYGNLSIDSLSLRLKGGDSYVKNKEEIGGKDESRYRENEGAGTCP